MPKRKKSRVLLVDDHAVLREGLRSIFASTNDLAVCGETENIQQTVAAIEKLHPDVAIVDVSLRDGEDGIELTRLLHQEWPALPVLVLSMHTEQIYCDRAMAAGARGYSTKSEGSKSLLDTVRQVLLGKSFVTKPATP